ncbi:hypothetical protein Goe7_c01020 [Bacillus phage vB_BveM-Goe7]|nr:hypothetical protein Goe7_c01020 [Bacillus phage vB_BveM-Goe7]
MGKWNIDTVKKYYEDHGCTFVSPEYKTILDKYTFICGCGNAHTTTFESFIKHKKRCKVCASAEMSEMRRLKKSVIVRNLEEKGLTYIAHRWEKSETALTDRKWLYVSYSCPKGHVTENTRYHSVTQAKYACSTCFYANLAEIKKLSLEEVREAVESKGMTLLSAAYTNNHTPITVRCTCGNVHSAPLMSIMHNHKCGCGRRGENSPRYRHDLTDEERRDKRAFPEYRAWVKSVYERDNYTCIKCGKRGGTLHAHHINSYARFPELRLELDNGATLCEEDHKEFHHLYGTQQFTAEDFYEYLKKH